MHGTLSVNMQSTGDGRIADLDFESTGSAAVLSNSNYDYIPYQITLYNLLSNGNNTSFYTAQGAQWGYIQLRADRHGNPAGHLHQLCAEQSVPMGHQQPVQQHRLSGGARQQLQWRGHRTTAGA